MVNRYFADSSVWIDYYDGTERGKKSRKIVEQEVITTSVLVIAEVADRFQRENQDCTELLQFIQNSAGILDLTPTIAVRAAVLKKQWRAKNPKFGLADALHLATAEENQCTILTSDKDFTGIPDVMIV